jgi:crotonobetainyl-CoA:carnitine CoA-transferase CaiB-like acyl-CoA transferase
MRQADPDRPPGPCRGLRVLDFTSMVSGPTCTQVLGDLGADVVKIEPPGGESGRHTGSSVRDGLSGYFAKLNRNKRSLVLDLRRPEGRDAALRLADRADVVVENFRPGVADRLGIGYAAMRERNPRLVYLAISGFGPDGPYADLPAYDHVLQGLTGLLPDQGGDGPPRMIQSVVVDKASGLAAASAALAALLARERGGSGQRIDVPMLDAYAAYMLPEQLAPHAFPELAPPPSPAASIFRTWRTRDGYAVGIAVQDAQFRGLCRAVGREDLASDARFATLRVRFQNLPALYAELEAAIAQWPTAELVERARREGAPFAPVNDFAAFLADPQTRHNATVFEVADAAGARTRYLTHAVRYEATPATFRRPPPRPGEHTEEVLREAGYSEAEVRALREAGVAG